jgi:hypothetical protein
MNNNCAAKGRGFPKTQNSADRLHRKFALDAARPPKALSPQSASARPAKIPTRNLKLATWGRRSFAPKADP